MAALRIRTRFGARLTRFLALAAGSVPLAAVTVFGSGPLLSLQYRALNDVDLPRLSSLGRLRESPLIAVLVVGFLVLSLSLHEYGHALVAYLRGDSTARDLGRMTPNPLPHIDPFMSILLPGLLLLMRSPFVFGGAKPVPVVFSNLRHPWRDMMLVAIAGPGMNVLLGGIFLLAWKLAVYGGHFHSLQALPTVLGAGMYLNFILAIFNMLPIPPLDGSRVLAYLLPAGSIRESYVGLERFGLMLVMLLVVWGGTGAIIVGALDPLLLLAHRVTGGSWIL